jgi:hypothetical protein
MITVLSEKKTEPQVGLYREMQRSRREGRRDQATGSFRESSGVSGTGRWKGRGVNTSKLPAHRPPTNRNQYDHVRWNLLREQHHIRHKSPASI